MFLTTMDSSSYRRLQTIRESSSARLMEPSWIHSYRIASTRKWLCMTTRGPASTRNPRTVMMLPECP